MRRFLFSREKEKKREVDSFSSAAGLFFLSSPLTTSAKTIHTKKHSSQGVIWRGDSVIDGVPETLDFLRSLGKRLVFVTNNSTKSRAGYLSKFTSLGLSVKAEEIYSSSYAAAAYLESIDFPKDKKVYVIGEDGIGEELDLKGIRHCGGKADKDRKVELKPGYALPHDADVGAVVVGFDRNINYYKIQYATLCISENPGCHFIATNTDARTHLTGTRPFFVREREREGEQEREGERERERDARERKKTKK